MASWWTVIFRYRPSIASIHIPWRFWFWGFLRCEFHDSRESFPGSDSGSATMRHPFRVCVPTPSPRANFSWRSQLIALHWKVEMKVCCLIWATNNQVRSTIRYWLSRSCKSGFFYGQMTVCCSIRLPCCEIPFSAFAGPQSGYLGVRTFHYAIYWWFLPWRVKP